MQTEESLGDLFELVLRVPTSLCLFLEDGGREGGGRVDAERVLRVGVLDAWVEAAVDVANDGLEIGLDDDLRYLLGGCLQIAEKQTRPVRFCWCC